VKAVIIAGGLGTRLRPLTYNTPKPIVPIANRPFVVYQIEHLVKHGVDEVMGWTKSFLTSTIYPMR
jgi:NDP-sugar pyrophosphorylase family protein